MKDKIQKIREGIEKLKSNLVYGACSSQVAMETYDEVLAILDTMQEVPMSSIWHNASEKSNKPESVVIINPNDYSGDVIPNCIGVNEGNLWACTSDLLNLDNPCKIGKNLQEEPVSEELEEAAEAWCHNDDNTGSCDYIGVTVCEYAFKAGAKWQKTKDESTTEDLGEYIDKLSKQFPEVSFAKLSRIAVRVAKWQLNKIREKYEENRD